MGRILLRHDVLWHRLFEFLALGYRELVTTVVVGVFRVAFDPRRRKLRILRPAACSRAHSLRCSSFPICTHCVGLQMGPLIGSKSCVTCFLALGHRKFVTAVIVWIFCMALDPM